MFLDIDAPRHLQITPRQSTYHPGDRIQCSAEGNPAPSYQWTDLVSGNVIQGAVLNISEDMADKYHMFRCTATNEYNTITGNITFTVQVQGRNTEFFICLYVTLAPTIVGLDF